MKYNLGAGTQKIDGFVSVDLSPKCGADIVADIRKTPWDWMVDADEIRLDNTAEHLSVEERIIVFNEAWEKMKSGGLFWIRVPLFKLDDDHISGAFSDPTHKTFWTMETIDYFNKDHPRGRIFGRDYGIKLWKVQRNEDVPPKFLEIELIKP